MKLNHSCEIIQFKKDIHFYLDFEGYTDRVEAKLLISSEDSLEADIVLYEQTVCESFIFKYTKDLIVGNDGLLRALLWGTPYFFIADKLNEYFDSIENDMEVKFDFETRGNEESTRLSPIFGAEAHYVFFETRDITEKNDKVWFSYRQIREACIGLDWDGIIEAKFEQDLMKE